jgi:hypothetical protein
MLVFNQLAAPVPEIMDDTLYIKWHQLHRKHICSPLDTCFLIWVTTAMFYVTHFHITGTYNIVYVHIMTKRITSHILQLHRLSTATDNINKTTNINTHHHSVHLQLLNTQQKPNIPFACCHLLAGNFIEFVCNATFRSNIGSHTDYTALYS